ncbi:MAG: phosphopyruvate hydratase [Deltaproteobacteria bacterium]|nr:phosphopyruvate hydratase [Deltaproteobacteria bacterium]
MACIEKIVSREIIDSRGYPTVETDVFLDTGHMGRAAVPSGASTGSEEALELRDHDSKKFLGKGVSKAISHVNHVLAPELLKMDITKLLDIDKLMIELDGTHNKSKLGANAILSVSMAAMRACAQFKEQPLFRFIGREKAKILPVPFMNVVNGGAHADNNVDIQEFMIVPLGFETFKQALRAGVEVFHSLKQILKKKNYSTAVGDEGGFAPNVSSHAEVLDFLMKAIEQAGYRPGDHIALALDVAASELYEDGFYRLENQNRSAKDLISFYEDLLNQYPIVSIEDGLAENDIEGWKQLTKTLGRRIQLVGDDLYVTNEKKLHKGIEEKWSNSILIKLNQIGTVSQTLNAVSMAQKAGWTSMISHRSGETEDTFIADLAVGTNAGQIKAGSLCRSERTAKYNQLLRIEEMLGVLAVFPGRDIFYNLNIPTP